MCKKILLVDDEVQVLKALMRAFLDTEYEVYSAEGGKEALEMLEKEDFDLVISDMRMPNMDGYQFLWEVKGRYPKILRVILSGYADEEIVFKALQRNIAKLYIFKPWENEKLIKLVDQIFDTEELLKSSNLLALITNVEELPTIKVNYQRILSCIDGNIEIADISRLIEQDQSIATKLLHIANSAYYGIKTGSVKQAVTYLGLSNVRNLVLSTSILDAFNQNSMPDGTAKNLWTHAFVTNKILCFLYEQFLNKKLPETSMSAGLLHNIGTVLLLNIFKTRYLQCVKTAEKEQINIVEAEKAAFGIDHQETGGYLLKWWELPFPIVEAALYHHDPFNDNIINKELLCAIHIAEKYSWIFLKQNPRGTFKEEVFTSLGIKKELFEEKLSRINIE